MVKTLLEIKLGVVSFYMGDICAVHEFIMKSEMLM